MKVIDYIYDLVDMLSTKGKFDKIDESLRKVPVLTVDLDICLAWLTAVLPCKTKLQTYNWFLNRVKQKAIDMKIEDKGLFDGF